MRERDIGQLEDGIKVVLVGAAAERAAVEPERRRSILRPVDGVPFEGRPPGPATVVSHGQPPSREPVRSLPIGDRNVAAGEVGSVPPRTARPGFRWSALSVTTLAFFLSVIDMSSVNVAFPAMVADLGGSPVISSWVVSGYNVTVGALLLAAGRLADTVGRKVVFIPGVAVFLVGSLAASAAPGIGWLIAARVLQGVGGSAVSATALAVVLPFVPPPRRGLAIGVAGAIGSLGAVAGPLLGSLVIGLWSWRAVFWLNVPVAIAILILAPPLLKNSRDHEVDGRMDVVGVVLGTLAVASVMIAIASGGGAGASWQIPAGLLAFGVVAVPLVIRRSSWHPQPVVAVDLFRLHSFRSTNVAVAAWGLGFASGFLSNSLFLQRQWQLPIGEVGRALVVSPLVAALVSPVAGRLADRIGHRLVLATGAALCSAGYCSYNLVLGPEPQLWTRFVPLTVIVGAGVGATVAGWAAAGMSEVPPPRFGAAEATIRTTQQVFFALGIAVVVTLVTAGGGLLAGYRQAWSFISLMFGCSALVLVFTFPARQRAGSRRADGEGRSGGGGGSEPGPDGDGDGPGGREIERIVVIGSGAGAGRGIRVGSVPAGSGARRPVLVG